MKFSLIIYLIWAGYAAAFLPGITMWESVNNLEDVITGGLLDFFINPCATFTGGPRILGEQTAAEWVRIVFHDMITHNKAAGTGGLDGSIAFESDRDENIGAHFVNVTIGAFNLATDAYTSLADTIAVGLVLAIAECNSSIPKLVRAGRVDATEAGPFGVPGPTTDLATTLAAFESAGFSQTDMITMVACGHSIGAVHHVNFPNIVDESHVSSTNLDGADTFDSTPFVFDTTGVHEYLSFTGKCGGPLVVGSDPTAHSDLRIFSSDNNATMQRLADPAVFQSVCPAMFERMLNTVPSGVELSEPIEPLVWKIATPRFSVSANGTLALNCQVRYLGTAESAPNTASYSLNYPGRTQSGVTNPFTGSPNDRVGNIFYGAQTFYHFTEVVNPSITSVNTDTFVYPVTTKLFIQPAECSYLKVKWIDTNGNTLNLTATIHLSAAIQRSYAPLKGIAYVPTPQPNTQSPRIVLTPVKMQSSETRGGYDIYSGELEIDVIAGFTEPIVKVQAGNDWSDGVRPVEFGNVTFLTFTASAPPAASPTA